MTKDPPMLFSPLISVIIITWNSKPSLPNCLDQLAKQTFTNFQVILVDNGSEDDSLVDLEKERYPFERIIEQLAVNKGFAAANNIGAHLARGKWLALLNADAFPEPDWLEKMLLAAKTNPEYSCFSSRQIQANRPELLDGAGDVYHVSGLAWRRHYNLPSRQFGLHSEEVFSPCGAAALYSREDFLGAGGFDDDYFSYFEDVDLGFRLRLNEKKCLYVPDAIVHHVGSASTGKRSEFSVYYGYRNLIWTFFKDMPSPLFWMLLPLHMATMVFFLVYLALRGQGKAIIHAIKDAALGMPTIIAKRKTIQQNRKVTSFKLLKVMSTNLLEPYLEFVQRNKST